MASGIVKPNRTKSDSKKSHSSWWDSHISSKSSKWLQENLEEMDQNVKKMLKLIEEDADSFAKKAELYFKKRPELLTLVEEIHRMYRSLAERYSHVTGELRKNIPSDLQSQGSGISDAGSEPPWAAPYRTKSGPRAAGFDFFLGSGGSCSDLNSKEGDDTSTTLDSDSESDNSSVNNYSSSRSNGVDEHGLRGRVVELEGELWEAKEKLRRQQQEISEGLKRSNSENSEVYSKIAAYEEELRVARERIRFSEEETSRLMIELQKSRSLGYSNDVPSEVSGEENHSYISDWSTMQEPNHDQVSVLQREVANLQEELTTKSSLVQNLQDQLKSAQKEVSVWKNKLEREKREVSKMQDRVSRYKSNLADRDQEIRGLREAMGNANKSLSEENDRLQAEMTRMVKERAYLEDNIKEMDLRCQSLEEEARRVRAAKDEMEAKLGAQIEQLMADVADREQNIYELNKRLDELKLKYKTLTAIKDDLDTKITALGSEMSSKDEEITELSNNLHQLETRHGELAADAEGTRKLADNLGTRVRELETDLERKQEAIVEAAEGKREAIRQLAISVEYYRGEYNELRLALIAHKRPAVMAR